MKKSLALTAVLFLTVPAVAFACEAHEQAAKESVKKVTVAELSQQLSTGSTPVLLDANNAAARTKWGVIPGATLLSSGGKYNLKKELPEAKDAKLVFYCATDKCTDSERAATRAAKAGYQDVSVLQEGISGWKKAGQKTLPRS